MPSDPPTFDSAKVAAIRDLLPTSLGSEALRDRIAAELRANAVFSARTGNAVYLDALKKIIDQVAAGSMDQATARVTLLELLRALRYTPEGGFPDDPPGEIPPAIAGEIRDLSSPVRLNLIIDTQRALMRGRGQQLRGMEPARLQQFPAWELVRREERLEPRLWKEGGGGSLPRHQGEVDMRSRWLIAGGLLTKGRMIALKGDPIWGELGSSGNFDDALDTDHPPFAFNSGMHWMEVSLGEARELGIKGPDGESIEKWLTEEHPVYQGEQPALPVPVISVKKLDPEMVAKLEKAAEASITGGVAYPAGADMSDRIAARRAAREARRAELADQATAKAAAAYAARGEEDPQA
jgi:hypothetical protein